MYSKNHLTWITIITFFLLAAVLAACGTATPSSPTPSSPTASSPTVSSPTATEQPTEGPSTEPGAAAATETPAPTQPAAVTGLVAYIGTDGNLWVVDLSGAAAQQLTTDAASEPDQTQVRYEFPRLSSDGVWLASQRSVGTPVDSGLQYQDGLWIYNINTGDNHQVYDQKPNGYDWLPGTHRLAYAIHFSEAYFQTTRGEIASELATGIWQVEAEGGEATELVKPERGYALVNPRWAPDGSLLSFEEVNAYEGSGLFAYYDTAAGKYKSWEEAIGMYSWSPDHSQIAYDNKTYAATGQERIFLRPLEGGEAQQFSPESLPGYANEPVFSPDGERIAYLGVPGGPDSQTYNLYAQDLAGGEPRDLGSFESLLWLAWTPDGNWLVFSAGPYPDQQVIKLNVTDGSQVVLGQGVFPDVADG